MVNNITPVPTPCIKQIIRIYRALPSADNQWSVVFTPPQESNCPTNIYHLPLTAESYVGDSTRMVLRNLVNDCISQPDITSAISFLNPCYCVVEAQPPCNPNPDVPSCSVPPSLCSPAPYGCGATPLPYSIGNTGINCCFPGSGSNPLLGAADGVVQWIAQFSASCGYTWYGPKGGLCVTISYLGGNTAICPTNDGCSTQSGLGTWPSLTFPLGDCNKTLQCVDLIYYGCPSSTDPATYNSYWASVVFQLVNKSNYKPTSFNKACFIKVYPNPHCPSFGKFGVAFATPRYCTPTLCLLCISYYIDLKSLWFNNIPVYIITWPENTINVALNGDCASST